MTLSHANLRNKFLIMPDRTSISFESMTDVEQFAPAVSIPNVELRWPTRREQELGVQVDRVFIISVSQYSGDIKPHDQLVNDGCRYFVTRATLELVRTRWRVFGIEAQ